MKIKVGGSASIKLMMFQYEPIEITSTMEIEKEFDDEQEAQEWFENQSKSLSNSIEVDLDNKARQIVKKQRELKNKLKEIM